jgi:hypothetical protein
MSQHIEEITQRAAAFFSRQLRSACPAPGRSPHAVAGTADDKREYPPFCTASRQRDARPNRAQMSLVCVRLARRHHPHQPVHLRRRSAAAPVFALLDMPAAAAARFAADVSCSDTHCRLPWNWASPALWPQYSLRSRSPASGSSNRAGTLHQGTSATSGVAESAGMPAWPTLIVRACSRWRGAGCACR